MNKDKKMTVGAASLELSQKTPDSQDPIELQRDMTKEYCDEVIKCALHGKSYYQGAYYVVVITKKEKIMQNVLRSYYFHRGTCPTPDYDQAVFRFDPSSESFQEIWVIPDQETCAVFYENALQIAPEEHQLRDYVIDFATGALFQKALKLNGEVKEIIN